MTKSKTKKKKNTAAPLCYRSERMPTEDRVFLETYVILGRLAIAQKRSYINEICSGTSTQLITTKHFKESFADKVVR